MKLHLPRGRYREYDNDLGQPGIVAPTIPSTFYNSSAWTALGNTAFFGRLRVSRPMTITAVAFSVSAAAGAANAVAIGVYDSALNRLATTGAVSAFATGGDMTTPGIKTIPLAFTFMPNVTYYIAFSYGAVTGTPSLLTQSLNAADPPNLIGSAVGVRLMGQQTSGTPHPLPATGVFDATPFVCPAIALRE